MKPEKPATDNMKKRARQILNHLEAAYPEYVSNEDLQEVIGVHNERVVRDIIAYISNYKPIISNSTQKGYKIARKVSDREAVRHTWAELSKRIEELEKRIKPLIKFDEKAKAMESQRIIGGTK